MPATQGRRVRPSLRLPFCATLPTLRVLAPRQEYGGAQFFRKIAMNFKQRAFGLMQALAVALALALPLIAAASPADARIGGGVSSGSRGARTFSAPPSTSTAPTTAQPFNRTTAQPGSPGIGAPGGGFFNRPGMGMFGGLAAGVLGGALAGVPV